MIKFACPECGKGMGAADEHAGKKARCPQCQHIMAIPQASPTVKPKPAPPPRPSAARQAVAPRPAPKPAPPARKAPPPEEDDVPEVEAAEEEVETLEEVEDEEEVEERPRRRRRRDEDEDEEGIQDRPRRRSRVVADEEEEPDEEEEEEEEERPRRRKKRRRRQGQWADCPNCGAPGNATRVAWTLWGGLIGPALICHVRCNRCGTAYNGKSGDYNTTAITIFVVVSVVIGLALGVLGVVVAEMK